MLWVGKWRLSFYGLSVMIVETMATATRHSFFHVISRIFATVVCTDMFSHHVQRCTTLWFFGNNCLKTFDFGEFASFQNYVSFRMRTSVCVSCINNLVFSSSTTMTLSQLWVRNFVRLYCPTCVTVSRLRCRSAIDILTHTPSSFYCCCMRVVIFFT